MRDREEIRGKRGLHRKSGQIEEEGNGKAVRVGLVAANKLLPSVAEALADLQ